MAAIGAPRAYHRRLLPGAAGDTLQDIRHAMCLALEQQGVEVESTTTKSLRPASVRSAPCSTAW